MSALCVECSYLAVVITEHERPLAADGDDHEAPVSQLADLLSGQAYGSRRTRSRQRFQVPDYRIQDAPERSRDR